MKLINEYALQLNNCEYGDIPTDIIASLKQHKMFVVYGHSDDIMMVDGIINDEFYDQIFISHAGVLENTCECDNCPNFTTDNALGSITPKFCGEVTFDFITDLPHCRFTIMEGDTIYGYGGIFSL